MTFAMQPPLLVIQALHVFSAVFRAGKNRVALMIGSPPIDCRAATYLCQCCAKSLGRPRRRHLVATNVPPVLPALAPYRARATSVP
jgi:hypothetical protein